MILCTSCGTRFEGPTAVADALAACVNKPHEDDRPKLADFNPATLIAVAQVNPDGIAGMMAQTGLKRATMDRLRRAGAIEATGRKVMGPAGRRVREHAPTEALRLYVEHRVWEQDRAGVPA